MSTPQKQKSPSLSLSLPAEESDDELNLIDSPAPSAKSRPRSRSVAQSEVIAVESSPEPELAVTGNADNVVEDIGSANNHPVDLELETTNPPTDELEPEQEEEVAVEGMITEEHFDDEVEGVETHDDRMEVDAPSVQYEHSVADEGETLDAIPSSHQIDHTNIAATSQEGNYLETEEDQDLVPDAAVTPQEGDEGDIDDVADTMDEWPAESVVVASTGSKEPANQTVVADEVRVIEVPSFAQEIEEPFIIPELKEEEESVSRTEVRQRLMEKEEEEEEREEEEEEEEASTHMDVDRIHPTASSSRSHLPPLAAPPRVHYSGATLPPFDPIPAVPHHQPILIPTPSSPLHSFAPFAFDLASEVVHPRTIPVPVSPNQVRHNFKTEYTLPPLSVLPAEFHRKSRPSKIHRRKEKEREKELKAEEKKREKDKDKEKDKAKDDFIPLGATRWKIATRVNPLYKKLARATKCLSTHDWSVRYVYASRDTPTNKSRRSP